MTCSNKGCKIKTNINPKSKLCQHCDSFYRDVRKMLESTECQCQAREVAHSSRRNLHDNDSDSNHAQDLDNSSEILGEPADPPSILFQQLTLIVL